MKVKFNNPAGRLLAMLEGAKGSNEHNYLAKAWGIEADRSSILAVKGMYDEYELMRAAIEKFKGDSQKYELLTQDLPEIEETLKSFNVSLNGVYGINVKQTGIIALRWISSHLPQEETADESELEALRQSLDELRKQVEGSEELAPVIRNWLLELIRIMRDGIERYSIRGSRGMKNELHRLLGDMVENRQFVNTIQKETPAIWRQLTVAMDFMIKLATLKEKYGTAIDFFQRAIPFFDNAPAIT